MDRSGGKLMSFAIVSHFHWLDKPASLLRNLYIMNPYRPKCLQVKTILGLQLFLKFLNFFRSINYDCEKCSKGLWNCIYNTFFLVAYEWNQ